jgi:release factor glutamine methyltransferase
MNLLDEPITLHHAYRQACQRLQDAGIDSALLDARLLLARATGLGREAMLRDAEGIMDGQAAMLLESLITRRAQHEPMAYILGEREFYGRLFSLVPGVLIPRPDSESLIELALRHYLDRDLPLRIADFGSGSGCLAVTLLAEFPQAGAVAVDASPVAAEVTRQNAVTHGVHQRLMVLEQDWNQADFSAIGPFDLLVSNPPYIAADALENLAPDVRDYEPHMALTDGADGLEAYRQILRLARGILTPKGHLLFEAGAGQAEDITHLAVAQGYHPVAVGHDLAGHPRALFFQFSS